MRILGISALSHDASLCLVEDGVIRFAAHAERYSRIKNDSHLNAAIVAEALRHGAPDVVAWYERPLAKKVRQAAAGQWRDALAGGDLPRRYLRRFDLDRYPLQYVDHHEAHAAAGFFTSPFADGAVVVADAIGEWTTFSIGHYDRGRRLSWRYQATYPHSLGLLYSAFTRRCGLKPNEEEYILMGMAAFGTPRHVEEIYRDLVVPPGQDFHLTLRANVHRGIGEWQPGAEALDLAASIQAVTEDILLAAVRFAAATSPSTNLILTGGVALNCVANTKLARLWAKHAGSRDRVWIMPNPGDAGSSLGAAAAVWGDKVRWSGPYLGTPIDRAPDTDRIVDALCRQQVVGLATGRAEFGPRALGHRSILADPRGPHMKDRVNAFKRREKFRPFAPVVLAEHAAAHFDLPIDASPYMQYAVQCKDPAVFPAVVHVDGSSRVQTVTAKENPRLHALLTKFHEATGCPMLVNTSMNVKGEPLVNTWADAERFSQLTGIPVFA